MSINLYCTYADNNYANDASATVANNIFLTKRLTQLKNEESSNLHLQAIDYPLGVLNALTYLLLASLDSCRNLKKV